ncbi:hypothetical protein SeMB42_g03931 [Synchytrium endobioticum]|uniref:Uncharacterized protein n=1 Tax=Synchytrium endobioticum TaxID=286115 RepID=A0A507D2J6_9FUNG|nr:hypothetical protein SeMB42_g03931 [Synchytrium endobioticum]
MRRRYLFLRIAGPEARGRIAAFSLSFQSCQHITNRGGIRSNKNPLKLNLSSTHGVVLQAKLLSPLLNGCLFIPHELLHELGDCGFEAIKGFELVLELEFEIHDRGRCKGLCD